MRYCLPYAEKRTKGPYTYTVKDGKATITGYTGPGGAVNIPIAATLGGCPVTTIGSCAFGDCTSPESVTIPASVTTIGDDAFSDCESLTSVTIPASVTTIGDGVFSGCTSLASVYFAGNTPIPGSSVFRSCRMKRVPSFGTVRQVTWASCL